MTDTAPGQFDRSFVIRMIRDFLIALTVIVGVELGGRALLAWREFQSREREATSLVAERLASDVRDIMLNEGGPVAARTVYPILKRNHEDLGYEIAIEPSLATVESIRQVFGLEARGIPGAWSVLDPCLHFLLAALSLGPVDHRLTSPTKGKVGGYILGMVPTPYLPPHREK